MQRKRERKERNLLNSKVKGKGNINQEPGRRRLENRTCLAIGFILLHLCNRNDTRIGEMLITLTYIH